MKVYICINHDGHYPVGVASVVVADNLTEAKALLDAALKEQGLKPYAESAYTLVRLDTDRPQAIILANGDY